MYLPFCTFPGSAATGGFRKESGRPHARRSGIPFLLAAVGLLFLAGRADFAKAATLANHMDAWESASLWCQNQRQQWAEHRLSGPLDPEQQVGFTLPSEPCFFLEVGLKKTLL